jgi:hypothetical protein
MSQEQDTTHNRTVFIANLLTNYTGIKSAGKETTDKKWRHDMRLVFPAECRRFVSQRKADETPADWEHNPRCIWGQGVETPSGSEGRLDRSQVRQSDQTADRAATWLDEKPGQTGSVDGKINTRKIRWILNYFISLI